MNRLKWGLLLLAAACGGKTIEDPPPDGHDDDDPVVPVPTSTPSPATGGTTGSPPPPTTAGTVAVGGGVGTGGSFAVGGGVGKGGSPASGGYGGVPYGAAEYGSCDGVALLPTVDWIDGPSEPADMSVAASGDWIGHAMSPWGEWDVEFVFNQDGSYSAYPLTPDAIALYYGTDLDSPLKRWWLSGASPVKWAVGEIDIVFDDGETFSVSGYQGKLDCMHTDEANERLRFEFWYDSESPRGPFVYDLQRL